MSSLEGSLVGAGDSRARFDSFDAESRMRAAHAEHGGDAAPSFAASASAARAAWHDAPPSSAWTSSAPLGMHATRSAKFGEAEEGEGSPSASRGAERKAPKAEMPLDRAFALFGEMQELKRAADGDAPEMPVVPLTDKHLESHRNVQQFAQNVEAALRYAYVAGPVIRTILAVIEMVGAVFTSAIMALQAAFVFPENDSEEAKAAAELKRSELLENAKYTFNTYMFHGITNLVRAAFEFTVVGHIALNAGYDGEFRHAYDLEDRSNGDRFHTALFDSHRDGISHTGREANVEGDRRYQVEHAALFKDDSPLRRVGPDFAAVFTEARTAREEHAGTVKEAKAALAKRAKDFATAERVVAGARKAVDAHEAAEKKYEEARRGLEERMEAASGNRAELARLQKELRALKAPEATRELAAQVELVRAERAAAHGRSSDAVARAATEMYPGVDDAESEFEEGEY